MRTGTEIGTEKETGTETGTVIGTTGIATIEDETHTETSVDVLALVTDVPYHLPVLCQQTSQSSDSTRG